MTVHDLLTPHAAAAHFKISCGASARDWRTSASACAERSARRPAGRGAARTSLTDPQVGDVPFQLARQRAGRQLHEIRRRER